MSGWITLHRQIKDHWVYENPDYFRAWVTMLMEVNYDSHKTLIKSKLLNCERGESLLSHASWAEKFGKGWNRFKVIRFFNLLESDAMIRTKNEHVTTRLIVNNYNTYQDINKQECTPNDTANAHQVHTKRTQLNKNNNINNKRGASKKVFKPPSVEEVSDYCKSRNNSVSPDNFVNFYSSKGWKVGSSAMKDWKACVRTWESRERKDKPDDDLGVYL